MAGRGPPPKDPALRQRTNKTPVERSKNIGAAPRARMPVLPKRVGGWKAETRSFWTDVWSSPMAGQFLQADVSGMLMLAVLIDQYWTAPTSALAAEIRLQRQCFGLTPMDRRRLEWKTEPEAAVAAPVAKRRNPAPARRLKPEDPRAHLRAVV